MHDQKVGVLIREPSSQETKIVTEISLQIHTVKMENTEGSWHLVWRVNAIGVRTPKLQNATLQERAQSQLDITCVSTVLEREGATCGQLMLVPKTFQVALRLCTTKMIVEHNSVMASKMDGVIV